MSSDNVSGGDNQQETIRVMGSSETARQAPPLVEGEDTVRPAWRHAEPGRNDLAPQRRISCRRGVTKVPKVAKFLVG